MVYLATEQAAAVNGLVFQAGSGKIGVYSHPTVSGMIFRDWRKNGPWQLDELAEILPATLLSGPTQAPFIPESKKPEH